MPKLKTVFVCTSCGITALKWEGKCISCGEWNTLVEEIIEVPNASEKLSQSKRATPVLLNNISSRETPRIRIESDLELERTLGGGIVPGSICLLGGQPGIGKSTLMLQLACHLNKRVLYVSGEESEYQIKMRAERIGSPQNECYILCDTELEAILSQAKKLKAELILIDSIQTLQSADIESSAGSITQVRECTNKLQKYAKTNDIPIFIVGHITKEGSLAGPKLLEHIVDVVLQFEGDQNYVYRILRTIKNRFGSTDEIGIYEMESTGMRPVKNPSELLFSQSNEKLSGCSIASTIEGVRPLLIETQALVSNTVYGTPQRSTTGFDIRRLSMLLAVLEKKCGLFFSQQDVFLNIAGGIRVTDPAIDLAIISALISSLQDIPIHKKICFAGEVGLSGEVRAVNRIDLRIQEADRLGFEQIFISKYHKKVVPKGLKIEVLEIAKVQEIFSVLFS